MRRVPAFTLLEVMLSLLLMVLLGIHVVFALQASGTHLVRLTSFRALRSEQLWAMQALTADMDRSVWVVQGDEGDIVLSLDAGNVVYRIGPDSLLRTDAAGRTAYRVPWADGHVQEHLRAPGLVTSWTLRSTDPAQPGTWTFNKDYDAASIIQYLTKDGDPHSGPH